jgi:hypothetical protein
MVDCRMMFLNERMSNKPLLSCGRSIGGPILPVNGYYSLMASGFLIANHKIYAYITNEAVTDKEVHLRGFRNKALFYLLAFFIFSADAAAESSAPSSVLWKGERLVFQLSWFGIPAGTVVAEASDAGYLQGRKMYGISAVTASNQFIDAFYPVRDGIYSLIFADTLASYKFKVHQEEGTYRSDKEIIFDYAKRKATFTKNGDVSTYDMPGLDPWRMKHRSSWNGCSGIGSIEDFYTWGGSILDSDGGSLFNAHCDRRLPINSMPS